MIIDDATLAELLAQARAAWPGVAVAPERYRVHLSDRLTAGPSGEVALADLRTDDLYLVCGCLDGQRTALDAFERAFHDDLVKAVAGVRTTAAERDDILQGLRESLFVRKALGKYAGRGQLRAWLRAVATREALHVVEARKPRDDREEEILAGLPATGDTELDLIRERFKSEFAVAFEAALAALTADERTLMAQHFVDGLTIDQLAVHQGVHRATVARRLVKLRTEVFETTRARLRASLNMDGEALDSLFRFARSRLDLSLHRLLRRS